MPTLLIDLLDYDRAPRTLSLPPNQPTLSCSLPLETRSRLLTTTYPICLQYCASAVFCSDWLEVRTLFEHRSQRMAMCKQYTLKREHSLGQCSESRIAAPWGLTGATVGHRPRGAKRLCAGQRGSSLLYRAGDLVASCVAASKFDEEPQGVHSPPVEPVPGGHIH